MGKFGIKHKKRYWIVCEDCHNRVRVAHPLARYCSDACKQHAYHTRRNERLDAAIAEAELQAARIEYNRQQARIEAERQQQARIEAERQRRQQVEQQAREQAKQQAEQQAAFEHRRKMVTICPVCSCGERRWRLSWDRKFLMGELLTQTCAKCGKAIKPTVSPPKCPHCHVAGMFLLDSDGTLTCHFCQQEYVWGKWVTDWRPGQAISLAPGHTWDNLKRLRYYASAESNPYRHLRTPSTTLRDDESDDDGEYDSPE